MTFRSWYTRAWLFVNSLTRRTASSRSGLRYAARTARYLGAATWRTARIRSESAQSERRYRGPFPMESINSRRLPFRRIWSITKSRHRAACAGRLSPNSTTCRYILRHRTWRQSLKLPCTISCQWIFTYKISGVKCHYFRTGAKNPRAKSRAARSRMRSDFFRALSLKSTSFDILCRHEKRIFSRMRRRCITCTSRPKY